MRIARALRRSGACLTAIGLKVWLKAMMWGRMASGVYVPSRRAALHSGTASEAISYQTGCLCTPTVPAPNALCGRIETGEFLG